MIKGNIGIVKKLIAAAAGVGQVNDLLNEKYVAKIPAIMAKYCFQFVTSDIFTKFVPLLISDTTRL